MMDAQELDPRLTSLEGTAETHSEQLSLNAKIMGAQAARLDTLDATVTEHKVHTDNNTHNIMALTQRLDNADTELAKVLSPKEAGLEIHSGGEEGGHVRIFADEIDLNGAVQVLDETGNLVNINNLPALVQQLRTEMNQVLEELNGDVANMREELRDLRSRCDFAYEWEVMPYTATSDRVCKPLTEVRRRGVTGRGVAALPVFRPLLPFAPSEFSAPFPFAVHGRDVRGAPAEPNERPSVWDAQDLSHGHV
jgi:uncharacterized coiled-coil protein SlyX